jgi:hypothetical protein
MISAWVITEVAAVPTGGCQVSSKGGREASSGQEASSGEGRKRAGGRRDLFLTKLKSHLGGELMPVLGLWCFEPNHSGPGTLLLG